MLIDCDRCQLQHTSACDDCVVAHLLASDDGGSVVVDRDVEQALDCLEEVGLVPGSRFAPGQRAAG